MNQCWTVFNATDLQGGKAAGKAEPKKVAPPPKVSTSCPDGCPTFSVRRLGLECNAYHMLHIASGLELHSRLCLAI